MEDGTFHVTLFTQVKGQPLKKKILSSHQDLFPYEAESFLENAEEVLLNMIEFGKDSGFIDVSDFITFILSLTDEEGRVVPEIHSRTLIFRQPKIKRKLTENIDGCEFHLMEQENKNFYEKFWAFRKPVEELEE